MPARDPGELLQELRALTPGTDKVLTWGSDGKPTWTTPAAGVTDHGALTGLGDDDHTQYQLESEKAAANGYASLDSNTRVPTAQLGSGAASSSNFLRGDSSWASPTASVAAPFVGDQATGAFTVATGKFGVQGKRLTLTSTQRGTIAGTGRLSVYN